jgi:hypothetical protein
LVVEIALPLWECPDPTEKITVSWVMLGNVVRLGRWPHDVPTSVRRRLCHGTSRKTMILTQWTHGTLDSVGFSAFALIVQRILVNSPLRLTSQMTNFPHFMQAGGMISSFFFLTLVSLVCVVIGSLAGASFIYLPTKVIVPVTLVAIITVMPMLGGHWLCRGVRGATVVAWGVESFLGVVGKFVRIDGIVGSGALFGLPTPRCPRTNQEALMKNQVIFRRLLKGIGLPLVYFWAGMIVLWLISVLVFRMVGFQANFGPMPIGIWLAVFTGLAYFNTEPAFDLAMQTGVSRRHIFGDLMLIWSGCTLLTAVILGLWSLIAPMPHLLIQDLGYHGPVDQVVLATNVLLVLLSLMMAAWVGILARIASMKVTDDNRWWFWLGLILFSFGYRYPIAVLR